MDVDKAYPTLSALVASKGRTLADLAAPLEDTGKYVNLAYASYCVANGCHRHDAADSYDYLGTLNTFAERISSDSRARKILLDKMFNEKSRSGFLDNVVEAAWFIHYDDAGYRPWAERPFGEPTNNSKDADVFVEIDGKAHWLGVSDHGGAAGEPEPCAPVTQKRQVRWVGGLAQGARAT